MTSCMWAPVYLDQERDHFQRVFRNMDGEKIQEIFSTTQNQIQGLQQTELFGLHGQLDWDQSQWKSCTLAHDNIYKQLKAKVYVVADSVLCLGGGCPEYLRSTEAWQEGRTVYFVSSPEIRELDNIDGEPFVFEWKIFPGHTAAQLLQEVQILMEDELKIHPQNFEDRIMFMSMYNDIDWTRKDNRGLCVEIHHELLNMPESFPWVVGLSLVQEGEHKWYGTVSYKPNGEWNCTAELIMLKSAESGHPVFRGTSPLSRASLKSKGGGKVSIHFNAEPQTAELLFHTVISVNQLSIHGAVARWCNNQVLPAAEPHVEHEAATDVPPELVSRLTKHKTLNTLAQRDLAQKRDELL